jgi:hypothetical protein
MRIPWERTLPAIVLRHAVHSDRQVFEAWEKSLSSSSLSSEATSTQPSHTRLARLPTIRLLVTRSRRIPPRRPLSPQPNRGSWKLSEKSQPSIVQPSASLTWRPRSKPRTRTFLSVTPDTPAARMPVPVKSFGSPASPPRTRAPRPSTVTPAVTTTIPPYVVFGSRTVSAVISRSGRSPPGDSLAARNRPTDSIVARSLMADTGMPRGQR